MASIHLRFLFLGGALASSVAATLLAACGSDAPSADDGVTEAGTARPEAGTPGTDGGEAGPGGDGGGAIDGGPRSCLGASDACGDGGSCCTTIALTGGTYARSFDGVTLTDAGYPATVSPFTLDRHEVTVGRFRAFLGAGGGVATSPPAADAGAHPKIAGSGWKPEWNALLSPTRAALELHLVAENCPRAGYGTWTPTPGANETKPVACVTWYEAFAFCAWDGGRLPTEAEWNYAAAGGDEQRVYPFAAAYPPGCADPQTCIDDGHATFTTFDPPSKPTPVGSQSPRGDGRFGHADLAGNVWEWTLDQASSRALPAEYPMPCVDCAQLTPLGAFEHRVLRGGGSQSPRQRLTAGFRNAQPPTTFNAELGFRCAR